MNLDLQLLIRMTSEVEASIKISELEKRVQKLEKIILEKEDVLNSNFEGNETLTDKELKLVEEAEKEIEEGNVRSLDNILEDLE